MRSMTIVIPILPDRRLSPNRSRHQHWGTTARAKKELREATAGATLLAKMSWDIYHKRHWQPLIEAKVDITVIVPDKRRIMDDDNLVSMLKTSFDVLETMKIIENDRGLHIGDVKWRVEKHGAHSIIFNISEVCEED